MSNRTLQRRMNVAWLALSLVIGLGALLGWGLLDAVDVEHQELAYGAAQDLVDIDALEVALQERTAHARGYLLSSDPVFLEGRRLASESFDARLRRLRAANADHEQGRDLARIAELERRLDAASDRAIAEVPRGRDPAIAIWNAQARPVQAMLAREVAELVAAQRARFKTARDDAHAATRRGRRALAGLTCAIALAVGLLFWQLARTANDVITLVGKEQEQVMFRVLDQVPVGIFVVDPRGSPYYANQWSARLLGRPPQQARDVQEIVSAYAAFEAGTDTPYPVERTPLARALRGESSEVTDMEIRRPDDVVPLHVRGAPILGSDDKLSFAVAAFQDVRVLHEAATRDPLTGLGNRRSLSQCFVRERLLQERAKTGMALAVVDLDHFKQVNDTHGHAIGDLVLKRTAANLVQALRRTDLVIRWGGEEIVIVLLNVDLAGAHTALDKALSTVRGETFNGAGHTTFHVTFSAGLVAVQPHESLDSVVARADALLYAAKRDGRNRIVVEGEQAAAADASH